MTQYLLPMSGLLDSHAKMSRWRAWAEEQGFGEADLASFMSLLDCLAKDAPELFYSRTFTAFLIHIKDKTSAPLFDHWPNSGILSDGVCLTARTLESPSRANESTLSGVIKTKPVPQKYFLTPSAAKGMLRRVKQMGRNLFPPLRESLETLAAKGQ